MSWSGSKGKGEKFYLSRGKIYSLRGLMLRSFCSQLRFLPTCMLCFWKWPLDRIFSNCFWPGKPASSCVLFFQYLNEEASWAFSTAETDKSIPTPTVGFISLCYQIAVITRVWKAQCLPRPTGVQAVIAPHKSMQGLLLSAGMWHVVICHFCVGLLLFA